MLNASQRGREIGSAPFGNLKTVTETKTKTGAQAHEPKQMKAIKLFVLTASILTLATPISHGQTFTFSTIAGGTQGANDGRGASAQFNTPTGVAIDAAGNLYIADQANNAIREARPFGTNWIVTTLAGGTEGTNDGVGVSAQFSGPSGIAVDSQTNLYIADQLNYTIRMMTLVGTNWVVSTIAGQPRVGGAQDGTSALFLNPVGIALDSFGNLIVADEYNNAIRMVSPTLGGWVVTTLAGGTQGYSDGTNSAAEFYDPTGVAVDSNENIFVADQFNNLIRLITPEGPNWVVTTLAGQVEAGSMDGIGTNASFFEPVSVALDSNDDVYVADFYNDAIREMTPLGPWMVTTIGGDLGIKGFADGTGTNALFYLPFGVVTDPYGDVFVTDSRNNAIRMGVSSSAAPATGSLAVTLTPAAAVSAGARWQLDGGALQASGVMLSNLAPGKHILTFSYVNGFTTPAYQPIIITAHQTVTTTGNYPTAIPNAGSLEVLMWPAAAVNDGAAWQVDGGGSQTNRAIVAGLSIGSHTLTFSTIPGWTTPATQTVVVSNAYTTLGLGMYVSTSTGSTVSNSDAPFTLIASPTNGGTVTAAGAFAIGFDQTVTATPNSGYIFTNWTVNGTVVSVSTNYTFEVTSNETLVANFLPLYTLAVTASPSADGTATATGTLFPGGSSQLVTATPNSGFEFVAWTGDGTGTSDQLTVVMNTNMDVTANFAVTGAMTLTVITKGSGAVTPNYNGKTLKLGGNYTLRATAQSGYVFSGWTGSITTNRNPLTVKLEAAVVLQANFVPDPFIQTKGTYNGLFSVTNGVSVQTAGMVRNLVVSQTGTYSGSLVIAGVGHGFSGAFDSGGQATNRVLRAASQGGNLTLVLTIAGTAAPQVTGSVYGTNNGVPWVADLVADRGITDSAVANYTMLIPPDTNNAPPISSPGGDGYASIATAATTSRITGALADGTAFTETVPVSVDGYIPIYASLYSNKGLLFGWINLVSTNAAGVSLTWIHPTTSKGLYTGGFTSVLMTNQIPVSLWTGSAADITFPTNLVLLSTINATNGMNFPITASAAGKITGASVSGSVNPKTGVFKVTVDDNGTKIAGSGAFLANATYGAGYFLTATSGEAILIQP